MAYSTTYANKVLAKVLNGTAFSFTPFISLHTSDPGATGANELAGGSYARANGGSLFGSAASGGTITNSAAFSYTAMPACTISHVGIWDASTSGAFVEGGPLSASVAVATGQTLSIAASQLAIGFSDSPTLTDWSTYLRNAVLNYMYRATAFSVTPYASLHTADPSGTGAAEVTGGTYARLALTMAAPSGGASSNTNAATISSMPACTVTFQGIWDASTAGNFLSGAPYSAPIGPIGAGNVWTWNAGDVAATLV
jgi:hypothetical protein